MNVFHRGGKGRVRGKTADDVGVETVCFHEIEGCVAHAIEGWEVLALPNGDHQELQLCVDGRREDYQGLGGDEFSRRALVSGLVKRGGEREEKEREKD